MGCMAKKVFTEEEVKRKMENVEKTQQDKAGKRKKITKKEIIIRLAVLVVLVLLAWYGNSHLVVSHYTYTSDQLGEDLEGYRIVQISDLHNARFGKENGRLLRKIGELGPDMIVLTGDLVDGNRTNIDVALDFAVEALAIAPVYYVTGNHEYWLDEDEQEQLFTGLREEGVYVLMNEKVTITAENASFTLVGLDDSGCSLMDGTLGSLLEGTEGVNVVLAHEPQYLDKYARNGADLVLCGHAHGGQFRIPYVGGLVAPDQGLFPKYTAGTYTESDTTMIVSRGLGNSIIPVRIFNDPEIVCVDLQRQ